MQKVVQPGGSGLGCGLRDPERCRLEIYPAAAGRIPLIVAEDRYDFLSLCRAFAGKEIPLEPGASVGAYFVSGLFGSQPDTRQAGGLARDRLILLSCGSYSNVEHSALGIGQDEWRKLSFVIRREHEATHYLIRRVVGRLRDPLYEELLADYSGMRSAFGKFRAEWFLRFMGFNNNATARDGARVLHYRIAGQHTNRTLVELIRAAHNLEKFDQVNRRSCRDGAFASAYTALALCRLTLQQASAPDGACVLSRAIHDFGEVISN
jgi:hypothetical protein